MNVKELIEYLEQLPSDMPIGILDTTSDDFNASNYPIKKDTLQIADYTSEEDGEAEGKMLFFTFENKLNENPV